MMATLQKTEDINTNCLRGRGETRTLCAVREDVAWQPPWKAIWWVFKNKDYHMILAILLLGVGPEELKSGDSRICICVF